MKRLPLVLLLAAGLVAATAQAQTVSEQTSTPSPAAAGEVARTTLDAPAADSDRKRLSDANCLRETGSRIARRDGKQRCTGQPGRSYSKDDLDRTGHTNVGDALRALDPAVR